MAAMKHRRGGRRSSNYLLTDTDPAQFNPGQFRRIAKMLKDNQISLNRVTLTVGGLQAIIRKTGLISYHVLFKNPDNPQGRLSQVIGHDPDTSLEEARAYADKIQYIANEGGDPSEAMSRWLKEQLDSPDWRKLGKKWRF